MEEGFRGVMRLDEVRQMERIPVLGTGKTDYKALRAMIQERNHESHETHDKKGNQGTIRRHGIERNRQEAQTDAKAQKKIEAKKEDRRARVVSG